MRIVCKNAVKNVNTFTQEKNNLSQMRIVCKNAIGVGNTPYKINFSKILFCSYIVLALCIATGDVLIEVYFF